jgi:hypothetical protein
LKLASDRLIAPAGAGAFIGFACSLTKALAGTNGPIACMPSVSLAILGLIAALTGCASLPSAGGADAPFFDERRIWARFDVLPDTDPSSDAALIHTSARTARAFQCGPDSTIGYLPDVILVEFLRTIPIPRRRELVARVEGRVVGGTAGPLDVQYTVWLRPTAQCTETAAITALQHEHEVAFVAPYILIRVSPEPFDQRKQQH